MDRRALFGVAAALSVGGVAQAREARNAVLIALYRRFVDAQNRRDLAAVRETLHESPEFLWVSDGKPFWGRETMLTRMAAFQTAEVWEVRADFSRSRVIDVAPGAAYLFQPLALRLGNRADARTIAFLVNILCVETPAGWRISALFTTEENPA